MTDDQFQCLAKLLRSRSNSREAARLVLVEGERACDVARMLGVTPNLVATSIANYRAAYFLIVKAFVQS